MDKRNQFQLSMLSSKLAEYTIDLENLKIKRSELCNSIYTESIETKDFLEQNKILEDNIQKYKNNIVNYRYEYARLNNELKLLPTQLELSKQQEHDIYQEDIENIKCKIQEVNMNHIDKLKVLEVEKKHLASNIHEIQNQVASSQENISSIQEHAHAYRKNTLLELQQKKHQKTTIIAILDGLKTNKELYNINAIVISNKLDSLCKLKIQLIDTYYNTNIENILQIPNARELLPEELLNTTHNNSSELFNAIISYLDKQIHNTTYQLSSISIKANRLDKTINTTSHDLKTKLEPPSREKIISFKDNYKNAKLEKTVIDEKLCTLRTKFDSWDIEVIDKVDLEHKMILESLESDKHRAKERYNIMISRLTNEHESNIMIVGGRLNQLTNDITTNNNIIIKTNQELVSLQDEFSKTHTAQIELDKINMQIANIELANEKLQIDINSLSC